MNNIKSDEDVLGRHENRKNGMLEEGWIVVYDTKGDDCAVSAYLRETLFIKGAKNTLYVFLWSIISIKGRGVLIDKSFPIDISKQEVFFTAFENIIKSMNENPKCELDGFDAIATVGGNLRCRRCVEDWSDAVEQGYTKGEQIIFLKSRKYVKTVEIMRIGCKIGNGLEENFMRALKHYSFNGTEDSLNSDTLTRLFVIKGVLKYLEDNNLEITEMS